MSDFLTTAAQLLAIWWGVFFAAVAAGMGVHAGLRLGAYFFGPRITHQINHQINVVASAKDFADRRGGQSSGDLTPSSDRRA